MKLLLALFLVLASLGYSQHTMSLAGPANIISGPNNITVAIASTGSDTVLAVQFDMAFPLVITSITPTIAGTANSAGKSVTCTALSVLGTTRCLVIAENTTVITDGIIVNFSAVATTPVGSNTFSLTFPKGVIADGTKLDYTAGSDLVLDALPEPPPPPPGPSSLYHGQTGKFKMTGKVKIR